MPRVAIPVTVVSRSGVSLSTITSDPANDHYIPSVTGRSVLYVRNNGASPATVQIPLSVSPDGQSVTPRSVSVPASGIRYIGPFTRDYLQPDGSVYVDVSDSSLDLGVLVVE